MWTLCAAGLAAAVPVEQSTVALASRGSLGRGTGLYEAGVLLGILLSAPSLAAIYGEFGWRTACVSVAVCLVVAAALIPLVLRAVRSAGRACSGAGGVLASLGVDGTVVAV